MLARTDESKFLESLFSVEEKTPEPQKVAEKKEEHVDLIKEKEE